LSLCHLPYDHYAGKAERNRSDEELLMTAERLPMRREIPTDDTWDLDSLYQTADDWSADVERLKRRLPDVVAFRGRLGESPVTLADALAHIQAVSLDAFRISMYAYLSYSVDTGDQDAGARTGQATSLASQVQAALSFADPELMSIGFHLLSEWMEREPRLAHYRHYFDRLQRRQAHIRSAEVEELLGSVRDPLSTASETHGILTNADLEFAPAQSADGSESFDVAQSTIGSLLNHADRHVRRTAWENYADAHLAMKNTMANCLVAGVKQDVFFARARRYDSSLEAALSPENLPVAVFHNLIDTYRRTCRPGTATGVSAARPWATRNCTGMTSRRHYLTARPPFLINRRWTGLPKGCNHSVMNMSMCCAGVRPMIVGSTSIPTRANVQARSRGAYPAVVPTS
jgi:oligoendopeptidase F